MSARTADEAVLQQVVFPSASEPDVIPLYLDPDEWTDILSVATPKGWDIRHRRGPVPDDVQASPLRLSNVNATPYLAGRRSLNLPNAARVSLASYYNAFPASYWRRWTTLNGVRLRVTLRGEGTVVVYRSNARAVVQRVDGGDVSGEATFEFALPFANFLDGGWYWFDLIAGRGGLELVQADWLAPEDAVPSRPGALATLAMTTLNREEYCLDTLDTIAGDPDARAVLDRILVVDQGSRKIRDQARFPATAAALGEQLEVIDQANVGGSGGFSRGMIETVDRGTSDFVLLLDDDVAIDPESIRRAVQFARYTATPTIIGGHMLDMYDKTKLHAFAEGIDDWTFMWGPITPGRHDFSASNLRQTAWMHQRIDVDYNGWWMSLIPVEVIREIGVSLPVFIKWDDAEFSLRAREHGFPTVTLPGAAVWHVSWVDKDDSKDWQAFFHARNRLIAALLHSPHRKGGRLPASNFASDVRHLLTMDYYSVALRQLAYESVFAGPGSLHPEMQTRLPQIRALAGEYIDSQTVSDIGTFRSFPKSAYFGGMPHQDPARPRGPRSFTTFVAKSAWRHATKPVRPGSDEAPAVHLPAASGWWRIVAFDSVAISNAEGSGVRWLRRDPATFRSLLRSSFRSRRRFEREWSSLRRQYRDALPEIVSIPSWRRSLGLGGSEPGTR